MYYSESFSGYSPLSIKLETAATTSGLSSG